MTWTNTLSTDIGKVRLELGDDTFAAGVLPDGSNLSDEQVQVFLDREGSVMRAVAGICMMLSVRWGQVSDLSVGPRRESYSQVAKAYAERAAMLRDQYGAPLVDDEGTVLSVAFARADGYATAAG